MSVVHRLPRLWLPSAVLLLSFFLLTCATQPAPDTGASASGSAPAPSRSQIAPAAGPCGNGQGDAHRDRPIVCVDDSADALTVNPDPVWVHDVMSTDRRTRPVIHWWTRTGGSLRIEFKDAGCVRDMNCNGNHCRANVSGRPEVGAAEKRCKYDVIVDGHPTLDPDTIIVGCCG
jgi:hypothetical protein